MVQRSAKNVATQAKSHFGTEFSFVENSALGYFTFPAYGATRHITVANLLGADCLAASSSEIDGACAVLAHSSTNEPSGDLLTEMVSIQHYLTRYSAKTPDLARDRAIGLDIATNPIEVIKSRIPVYKIPVSRVPVSKPPKDVTVRSKPRRAASAPKATRAKKPAGAVKCAA